MTGKLSNKVAVITGGASGIGEATSRLFAAEGAAVVIADLNAGRCEALAREISADGGRAAFIVGDLRDPAVVDQAGATALDRFGGWDVLVNSAGVGELKPTHDVTADDWRRTLSINLDATFLTAQAAIRHMRANGGGVIVNIASIHGLVGFPAHAAYTASKGGVVNLTRSLALEYGGENIRVNAVCPGFVMTPMIEAGVTEALMPQVVAMHPIGRIGLPDEIARAVLFLASDDASFITGASLAVDGGYTAQ